MSLQKPSNLLPEKLPDKSISAVDGTASPGLLKSQLRYWKLAWRELEQIKGYRWIKVGGKFVNTVLTLTGLAALSIVLWLWPLLPPLAWLSIVLGLMVLISQTAIYLFGHLHDRAVGNFENEKRDVLLAADEDVSRARTLHAGARAEAEAFKDYGKKVEALLKKAEEERDALKSQVEELTKYRVRFELDEVSTRVFVQTPSEGLFLIIARIKLRFENLTVNDWSMKKVDLTLHELSAPQEKHVYTFVVNDRYFGASGVEIPRESFEGMVIQGGRLTEWYTCSISLMPAKDENFGADQLTSSHFLRLSMQVSNQPPLECSMFIEWERAGTERGAPVLSFGAPAVRFHENRRLRDD
jgi:hypothetical protein